MPILSRRELLQASTAVSLVVLAGCSSVDGRPRTTSPQDPTETTGDSESFTDWERSTPCDSMHDSIIKIEEVATSIRDGVSPIHFADLSAEERTILETVTEEGGYGTCDPSPAFERFLDRVKNHLDGQEQPDMLIHLERNGTYYQLYIENLDKVFVY